MDEFHVVLVLANVLSNLHFHIVIFVIIRYLWIDERGSKRISGRPDRFDPNGAYIFIS